MRWRHDGRVEEARADEAVDRRALAIVERRGCDWTEALACAVESTEDGAPRSRGPRVQPGRRTLSELADKPALIAVAWGRAPLTARLVSRRAERTASPAEDARELLAAASRGAGQRLPDELRASLERALGADLTGVRVHTDGRSAEAARAIHASAYSIGRDIHFAAGRFDPATPDGRALIAHEVAHTVQQPDGGAVEPSELQLSSPDDHHEIDAERFASEFRSHAHDLRAPDAAASPIAAVAAPLATRQAPAGVIHRSMAAGAQPAPAGQPAAPPATAPPPATSAPRTSAAQPPPAAAQPTAAPPPAAAPAAAPPPAAAPSTTAAPAPAARAPAGTPPAATSAAPATTGAAPAPAASAPAPAAASAAAAQPAAPAGAAAVTPSPAAGSPASAGAANLIAQIQAAGQAGKQRLAQQITTSAAAITAAVAQQKQALTAAGASQRAAVKAQIAAARSEASTAVTAAKGQLHADGAAKQAAATAAGQQAQQRATAATTDRQTQAHAAGDAVAAKTEQHGQTRAADTRSTVERLANQARTAGASGATATGKDADSTTGKRQAASQLAADTSSNVMTNLSSLLGGVTSAVTEAATSLRKSAGEAADALGHHLPSVVSHLGESASAAASGIGELVSGAAGALSELVGHTGDKLGELEQHALHDLDHQLSTKQAELDRAGHDATEALHRQGTSAQQAADRQIKDAVAEAGKHDVTADQARNGGAQVTAKITGAFDGLLAQVTGSQQQLSSSLAQVGGEAVAKLSTFADGIGGQARKIAGVAHDKAQGHVATVKGQTAEAADRAHSEIAAITDSHARAMDQAVDQTRSQLDAKHGEVAAKIDGQVASDISRVRGPVDSLAGRISGAQNAIDNRSWWDSVVNFLSNIGSWLKRQWNDFVEIIKDPGFWAGLVVGILASVVLGPVLGSMIGAAVGTIVSNVCATPPRPWYQGVLKNMAIAGVFTAAIVVAVAAAVAAGASALVVFIVVEVVTIIGTIVTNWINGERWDKGLLANMAIIGILHLIFTEVFPRVSVKPGEPEIEPKPIPTETRAFTELVSQMSAKAQEAVAQQRQLRSPDNMQKMENIGRKPDGTYDVDKATKAWEAKWMNDADFQKALAKNVAELSTQANNELTRIKNTCDDTDGTNRKDAKVGDGSTEDALRKEARTGEPVGGRGHAAKSATAVNTLKDAVSTLQRIKPNLASEPALTAQIDAAIARATARIAALQAGLDVWNARAALYPKVWYPDGTPRPVVPPVPPLNHEDQPDQDQPDGSAP